MMLPLWRRTVTPRRQSGEGRISDRPSLAVSYRERGSEVARRQTIDARGCSIDALQARRSRRVASQKRSDWYVLTCAAASFKKAAASFKDKVPWRKLVPATYVGKLDGRIEHWFPRPNVGAMASLAGKSLSTKSRAIRPPTAPTLRKGTPDRDRPPSAAPLRQPAAARAKKAIEFLPFRTRLGGAVIDAHVPTTF